MSTGEVTGDEATVAIAGFLHLIRLMGAELVAGQHRDDVERLIKAVEKKLQTVRIPSDTPESTRKAGLAMALRLLTPVFAELRDRSEKAHLNDQFDEAPSSRLH